MPSQTSGRARGCRVGAVCAPAVFVILSALLLMPITAHASPRHAERHAAPTTVYAGVPDQPQGGGVSQGIPDEPSIGHPLMGVPDEPKGGSGTSRTSNLASLGLPDEPEIGAVVGIPDEPFGGAPKVGARAWIRLLSAMLWSERP